MNQEQLTECILQFEATGIIPDQLIEFYDQNGKWRGDHISWVSPAPKSALSAIRQSHLSEARRTATSKSGPILLTSFVWRKKQPLTITYAEIKGSLVVSTNAKVHAANLRHVGGHLILRSSHKIYLPYLRTIGGKFECAKGFLLHSPRLREVGGACRLTGVVPPKLERVGGTMVSYWVFNWSAPCLKTVAGALLFHRAEIVMAPMLEGVMGNLVVDSLTRKMQMPKLKYIGGDFLADKVAGLRAPLLRSIGGDMDTGSAIDFYHPDIRVGGQWKIHPNALNNWVIRQTARKALRGPDPDFEI